MSDQGIGSAVRRKEDYRFLTGAGQYTDDIVRPGQLYAYLLRSPFAHAKITTLDTTAARASAGVVAVYTGADLAAAKVGGIPCGWQITNKDGATKMKEPAHPALAIGKVRHVGDPVAMVVAESREQARSAALAIVVEYDELPAVISMPLAIEPGATAVHDEAPDNTCFDWAIGDAAATDAAFARAAHVTSLDLINNRLIANPMEPRAANAEFDRSTGDTTLYTTSQNPHLIRLLLGAFVLGIPEHKLRVVAPDVGGAFGCKIFLYAEEVLVTFAARQLARPVKWTSDRSEAFMSDAHGRDHVTHASLALDAGGKFIGLRVNTLANMGAYLSTFAPAVPTWLHGTLMSGCYTTPAIYCEVRAIFTNTVPVDAYRGAGRPEATYVLERLVDAAARELAIDPVDLRRRNFIKTFPYATPVGLTYDSGDYEPTLDLALKEADYAGFEQRRAASRAKGKLRGIGLATYVEACGIAPSALVGALGARAGLYEAGQIRVHPTGSVTVFTGTHSHGQGHETTFAQLISTTLGVPFDQIEVVHGDTAKIPFGMGTYGSRSISVGGSALVKAADKIIAKGKKIAAHLLEAAESDIEFKEGKFTVAGTDRSKTFGEIALTAYVPHNYPIETVEPGLEETAFYDPKNFTYPAGCHIAEVEIDPDTGVVSVLRFTVADDVGTVINPMIVDGQIHGGVAQGIGQALYEGCVYDQGSGQLMTGSYMSYQMPRAADLPSFDVGLHITRCTHNPIGVKGVGEVGAIGAPAAVINAVVNALAHLGIKHVEMPATSERVWRAIKEKTS